jgi:hypothetical protein
MLFCHPLLFSKQSLCKRFPMKILYAFLVFPHSSYMPAHLSLTDFAILTVLTKSD